MNGKYYLFDCLGVIYDSNITGLPDNMVEVEKIKDDAEAVRIAQDHEATLIKYEYKDGQQTSRKVLYECMY